MRDRLQHAWCVPVLHPAAHRPGRARNLMRSQPLAAQFFIMKHLRDTRERRSREGMCKCMLVGGISRGGGEKTMALNRRQFLKAGTFGIAAAALTSAARSAAMPSHTLRVALLHMAPRPGDLAHNRRLVETAVTTAAGLGAAWVLTPELCICGYDFADEIGTDWIVPPPDPWMRDFCQLVARLHVTVFLSHPERDPRTAKLHNSVFVIAADGTILGTHRKINTLRVSAEAWSSPGDRATPIPSEPFRRVGILICADAYSPGIAQSLQAQGAELLVSSAAWAPGLHGPDGEWERCTRDTALPLFVCNRTGPDRTLDFTGAESVIVKGGQRLLTFRSERSAIFTFDWDLRTQTLVTPAYQRTDL
jgi:predicted amidohydrolase